MVRSAVHGLTVVCVGIVAWLFVRNLNQRTYGPLHEPYEYRTAEQPNDFGEIIDNQTALRAVGPLIPPAPSPPAKAPGAKGGQANIRVRY